MASLPSVFDGAEFVPAYKFHKFDQTNPHGEQTGIILHINTCKYPMCVIDIDFKLIPENRKIELRPVFLEVIPQDCVVVQTAHGGFHIYCKFNHFPRKNRYTGIIKTKDFDVDIFFASHPSDKSNVVFPGSRIKDRDDGPELTYHFVRGDEHATALPDVEDVVRALNTKFQLKPLINFFVEIREPQKAPPPKQIVIPRFVNEELLAAIINGFEGFVLKKEGKENIDFVFLSLNAFADVPGITNEIIDGYYEILKTKVTFENDQLKEEFNQVKEACKDKKSSWSLIMKLVSKENPAYYRSKVATLAAAK